MPVLLTENGNMQSSVFSNVSIDRDSFSEIAEKWIETDSYEQRRELLESNDKASYITSLTGKLYDLIVKKNDKIDYGTIEKSRGDITKIDHYTDFLDTITLLRNIVVEYKQSTEAIDAVNEAIGNLRTRKALWQKSYQLNLSLPIILYQSMTMACIASISWLIDASIVFFKESDTSYKNALDKAAYQKSVNNVLFKNIIKFNESCRKGEIDKCINHTISTNMKTLNIQSESSEVIFENPFVVGAIILTIFTVVLSLLKNIVYLLYSAKQSVSDYFAIQARLLEQNASELQYSSSTGFTDEERNKIVQSQYKKAASFQKIANKLAITMKKAEAESDRLSEEEKRKYKVSELASNIDDAGGQSFV